jgi:hypothetical protein
VWIIIMNFSGSQRLAASPLAAIVWAHDARRTWDPSSVG